MKKPGTLNFEHGTSAAVFRAGALGFVFLLLGSMRGETGAAARPAWLAELTKTPRGERAAIAPCRLRYSVSWSKVVVAGRAEVVLGGEEDERYPGMLVGRSEGESRGAARAIWPYDHSFVSIVDPRTLRPVAFHSTEIDRKETLWTTSRFDGSGVKVAAETLEKKSGKREKTEREFPFPQSHSMMSAFLYARSLDIEVGEEIVVLVYPFSGAYLVRMKMLGREKHSIGLGEFDAIKVDLDVAKVEGDLSLKHYEKVKKATAWVSDDEHRLPLELRAELFVGSIRVILKEREFFEG